MVRAKLGLNGLSYAPVARSWVCCELASHDGPWLHVLGFFHVSLISLQQASLDMFHGNSKNLWEEVEITNIF